MALTSRYVTLRYVTLNLINNCHSLCTRRTWRWDLLLKAIKTKVPGEWAGGGRYSPKRPIRVCAAPRCRSTGRDFGTSHLERGIQIEEFSKPCVYYFDCMKASKYEQRFQLFIENKTCFLELVSRTNLYRFSQKSVFVLFRCSPRSGARLALLSQ